VGRNTALTDVNKERNERGKNVIHENNHIIKQLKKHIKSKDEAHHLSFVIKILYAYVFFSGAALAVLFYLT
jgi:hypothetical protein